MQGALDKRKEGFLFGKINHGELTLTIISKTKHDGRNEIGSESFDSIIKIKHVFRKEKCK